MKAKPAIKKTQGTFAVPRYFIPEDSSAYAEAQKLFGQIKWRKQPKRADAIKNRFNAFSSLLWAVTTDEGWTTYTDLNKASYDIRKWPINYDAMSQTVQALKDMGWLEGVGLRTRNRQLRYVAPPGSPMRKMASFKVSELSWEHPNVEIRLGGTDLEKAPLDVKLMANAEQKAWNAKYLLPVMADLNDKLLDHGFTLFPFGKEDDFVQVQYYRIYTNLPQPDGSPWLTHGRIYPQTFRIPSKQKGWRQRTLINDKPTIEVDVHASGLRLLAEDYHVGFHLPETDDLYTHGKLSGLKRDLTKKIIQAVINGVSLDRQSWPKSFKDDKKTAELMAGEDWKTYAKAISETYPALLRVREDMGLDLMLQESDIIIGAMNHLLDKGIGCISIHDCLIVPQENVKDAKEAFYFMYEHKGFKQPKLSVGW
ncbi:MAG: hypothetical protein P8P35_16775 [Planktotalea sp.]|uniref:hypothetical protein n=1 Tax=Planktotalea sp. TaxID=2029877 RepID=UPI002602D0E5|nr:hypothetical protein [Planktotalea sp.]MDG1085729.1 hypothetical protein [Planktotalea sp.]